MRNTRKLSLVAALVAAFGMLMANFAYADNLVTIVAENGVGHGGVRTIEPGGTASIPYYLQSTGRDCDATAATPKTFTIVTPAGVTASPSSLEFTECDARQSVAFSSSTRGTYSIDHSDPDGVNTQGANFKLQVGTPDVVIEPDGITDTDGDGIEDGDDNCPDVSNVAQADSDGDGIGDACDGDRDGDTVLNGSDNCPDAANTNQADQDGDGLGNACDGDLDGDGVNNGTDNCSDVANADQADLDGDGLGDACDPDIDGDGVLNASDNCPLVSNADQVDNDGDGFGLACDSNDYRPEVGTAALDANGTEGDTLSVTGSFTDGDGNGTLDLDADETEGTFTDNGDGTWSWTLATTDDVTGGTITVIADDGEHAAITDDFTYSAANANPVVTGVAQTRNGACSVTLGAATFSDAGSGDTHTTSYLWDDGSTAATRNFTGAGSYSATVTVTDDDNGSGSYTANGIRAFNTPSSILQPINNGGSRSGFKIGSTIPVKITVTGCDGKTVTTLTPSVNLQKGDSIPDVALNETVVADSATNGKQMRYDATGAQYIYNLSTKLSQFTGGQLTQGTYTVSVHDASFAAPVKAVFDLRK